MLFSSLINQIAPVAAYAAFYTIRHKSNTEHILCINGEAAGLKMMSKPSEIESNCKFFFGGSQFKNAEGAFLCREEKTGNFKKCLTKNAPHSTFNILVTDAYYILKQDVFTMVKSDHLEDIDGYLVKAVEKPAMDMDKFLIVSHNLDTGDVISRPPGPLPENMTFSTL